MGCGMRFILEKYEDIKDEISILYDLATSEVVGDCPYDTNINHEQFIEMDNSGLSQIVTAREDGELVGFHISTITSDIFYKDKKTAFVLLYFLKKDHRGGGRGLKMFEYADDLFFKNGVDRTFMSRKIHIDNEKLFDHLGFNQIEANYEKYYDR